MVLLIPVYWYDYTKPKYEDKEKLCCTNTEIFIVHKKSEDIHINLAEDV